MTDLVCVKKFGSRSEAEIAKGALNAEKIAALIQSDDAGGMYPFMSEKIQLFVTANDKEKAIKILH